MAEAHETPQVKLSLRLELDDLLTWGELFRFVEIARQYEVRPDSTIPCHVGDDGNVHAYILSLSDKKIRPALRELMLVARHAFVLGLSIPADGWRVLHPPVCEPIKSICPYELARHVRADGLKTISGKHEAMFWVTLDPGDPTVDGGGTLVVGKRVDPADIRVASGEELSWRSTS